MIASDWLKNHCFYWFTGWSSSGYAPTIETLRGSALVTGFDYGVLFSWVPFLVHLFEFPLAYLPDWNS